MARDNARSTNVGIWRLVALGLVFLVWGLLLAGRLYALQVADHATLADLSEGQHAQRRALIPKRGDILDARGKPLALSVMYDSLYGYGPWMKDISGTARELAPILEEKPEEIEAKIRGTLSPSGASRGVQLNAPTTAGPPALLKARIPASAAARVAALNRSGLILRREPYRTYPEGSLAAQVLGFVGKEFHGLSGLELTMDQALAGKPGSLDTDQDIVGGEIAVGRRAFVPPREGATLVLTLDRYVQRQAETLLAEAVRKNEATGGTIIVLEPRSGDVMAMASLPTFKLSEDGLYDERQGTVYRPLAATDLYEPGSVMKLITMAAGLEEGLVGPETTFVDTGVARVGGTAIRNWDYGANGTITMRQVLVRSVNVGAVHVSQLLGPDRFYKYPEAFGFGKPTGIPLNGEAPGSYRTPASPDWRPIDLATASFGQGIAVTPIQVITAAGAIANGGMLMKPRLVKEIRGASDIRVEEPHAVGEPISAETASTLADMMISAMEQPALLPYRLAGYKLAGKTGTADMPGPDGYKTGKTYASHVGFGPAHDPRFVILVKLDAPKGIYGGVAAAPVFFQMARILFEYFKIPPESGNTR